MLELAGRSIAEQIAIGQLHFYRREPPVLAPRSQRGPQEELERFQQGQRQAVLQLAALYDRAFAEVGEETASIFAIHAMLLEDEDLVRTITDMIQREGATAEYAVKAAGDALAAAFGAMDSPYMRARSVDMRDISRRMLRALLGRRPKAPLTRPGTILVFPQRGDGVGPPLAGGTGGYAGQCGQPYRPPAAGLSHPRHD